MAKCNQVWSRNLLQETDALHSPTCSGSSFLDPKIWDALPISTAGFCPPPLLPDILCISTAAPKALTAINHFFITSSILSALQAHLYPSVFPASFNPDFHFYPPSITAIWSISLTASSFSNFLIPALPSGPSFPKTISTWRPREEWTPKLQQSALHLHWTSSLWMNIECPGKSPGCTQELSARAAENRDINKAQLRFALWGSIKSEPLTAPQNCSTIPGKGLQLLGLKSFQFLLRVWRKQHWSFPE